MSPGCQSVLRIHTHFHLICRTPLSPAVPGAVEVNEQVLFTLA